MPLYKYEVVYSVDAEVISTTTIAQWNIPLNLRDWLGEQLALLLKLNIPLLDAIDKVMIFLGSLPLIDLLADFQDLDQLKEYLNSLSAEWKLEICGEICG